MMASIRIVSSDLTLVKLRCLLSLKYTKVVLTSKLDSFEVEFAISATLLALASGLISGNKTQPPDFL